MPRSATPLPTSAPLPARALSHAATALSLDDAGVVTLAFAVVVTLVAVVGGLLAYRSAQTFGGVESLKEKKKKAKAAAGAVFLTKARQTVELVRRTEVSHDTRVFTFALPGEEDELGLPLGKHVKVFVPNKPGVVPGEWNGKPDPEADKDEVERKYTPTSAQDAKGHFELLIKVYKPNERFKDGGKASQYFESLKVGDTVDIQGPFGLVEMVGRGVFKKSKTEVNVRRVGMMAGGSGITPMLQIIEAVCADPNDSTQLSLIFANQTEGDILLRSRLDELARKHPNFRVWYTLDRPPASGWAYSTGFITPDMVAKHLPAPGPDTLVLLCGPPPMLEFACKPALAQLGFEKSLVWEF